MSLKILPKGSDVELNCVESQEYTFGLNNTGTRYTDTATYEIHLSDGSSITFDQAPTAGWSAQINSWTTSIQAAADTSGLRWFVSSRFRWPADPTNISGGGGLPGPSSEQVSLQLTNMTYRYVNIQICPGTPVPVRMVRTVSALYSVPYDLATDGAVLGPIQKFWLRAQPKSGKSWFKCGDGPDIDVLEDDLIALEAGEIPNCWEPCGTLLLAPSPPGAVCTFVFDIGCDDQHAADVTAQITRRAKFCDGEQVELLFFEEDPTDPTALIDYTLLGSFIDCDLGTVVDQPDDPTICTVDDAVDVCIVEQCTLIDSIDAIPTASVWQVSGSGTATHGVKHAPASQTITDQINAWVTAGYVVVMESDLFGTAVVDTMDFYSATGTTFTAGADHTQPDPCALFSQAVDGASNAAHVMTYTAYAVADEAAIPEKVLKTEVVCQRQPLEVVIIEEPEPTKTVETNVIAGCDDVNGDGSVLEIYYTTQTLCYESGVLIEQTLSDPYDENLEPYTVANAVPCDPITMGANPQPYCDNGTNFIRYSLSLNGAAVVVIDVEVDGVTPYTVLGPVTPGVCQLFKQDPDVEVCGTKGSALVGTGRGGIYNTGHSDFFLGTIGPAATFEELQTLAADADYQLWIGPHITEDGSVIADGGLLCVTGAPEIATLTYLNGFTASTVTVNLIWEQRLAQLSKICNVDELACAIASKMASILVVEKDVQACYQTALFHDAFMLDVGFVETYEICVDGTTVQTIVHDHLSTFDGTNRSTMYTPVISALNALPNWTFTLLTESAPLQTSKQEWRVDYSGPGNETLEVKLHGDTIRWHVDALGVMTPQAFDAGTVPASPTEPNIDYNTPVHRPCE